jgi:hypothetical protein
LFDLSDYVENIRVAVVGGLDSNGGARVLDVLETLLHMLLFQT